MIECQHPQFSLSGQVALITGAGSPTGIGFATATLLAELGCRVALCATGPRVYERARDLTRIVNVSSVTGPMVGTPGEAAYGAAKAGMVGMSRPLALEVAAQVITVNCVAPGWVASGSHTPEEARGALHTPIGRAGTPTEAATAIARPRPRRQFMSDPE